MASRKPSSSATDVILPMKGQYMEEIVRREKTYEFRSYRISATVSRVWFYCSAPVSGITYICEIDPGRTREKGDAPLPEDGRGNREFNTRHADWKSFDYAYRIRSVRKLKQPLMLATMKENYGFKLAPRGMMYLPAQIALDVQWQEQELLWAAIDDANAVEAGPTVASSAVLAVRKRKRHDVLESDGGGPVTKRSATG